MTGIPLKHKMDYPILIVLIYLEKIYQNEKYYKVLGTNQNILREKSLAIYFKDSQFRRNGTFNIMLSNIYVDKRSRIR